MDRATPATPLAKPHARSEIRIGPQPPGGGAQMAELWRWRGLIASMVRRQIRLDYRDLGLGFFWAVARPLLMLFIFTAFRHLSSAHTGVDMPYPVFLLSGLFLWFYFIDATTSAANAVARDVGLLRKIYFPRLISPLVPVLAGLAAPAVGAVPLVLAMVWFEVVPGWPVLLLPLVIAQTSLLALGIGLVVAALSISHKDWNRLLNLILYVGLFVSPVIYGAPLIPHAMQPVLFANPMAGALEAIRACLDGMVPFPTGPWLYSLAFTAACLGLGVTLFRRAERGFVDRL